MKLKILCLTGHKRLYLPGIEAAALSEAMNRRNPEIFKAIFEELSVIDYVVVTVIKVMFTRFVPRSG